MKKNLITEFINWYIVNREGKDGVNYIANNYGNDKNKFVEKITEYAEEFKKSLGYDLFDVRQCDIKERIKKLDEDVYKTDTAFFNYSLATCNHMPRALFGSKNYIAFLSTWLQHAEVMPQKVDPFFAKNEFITWLREEVELKPQSAASYVSYVTRVNERILKLRSNASLFESIEAKIKTGKTQRVDDYFDGVFTILNTEIHQKSPIIPVKTVRNYLSGLRQYRDFLISALQGDVYIQGYTPENLEDEEVIESLEFQCEPVKGSASDILLTYKDLEAKFMFRLMTQDRCSGDVYFPIRLLKKIFYKQSFSRKYLDDWMIYHIANIQVHTNCGSLRLRDISEMTISGIKTPHGNVRLLCKDGKERILYTRVGDRESERPLVVSSLCHIVIDHIRPMKIILNDNRHLLPTLQYITSLMVDVNGGKVNSKDIIRVCRVIFHSGKITPEYIPALMQELECIKGCTALQLMDTKENLIKKAKF